VVVVQVVQEEQDILMEIVDMGHMPPINMQGLEVVHCRATGNMVHRIMAVLVLMVEEC
jgi:hypothetical protein